MHNWTVKSLLKVNYWLAGTPPHGGSKYSFVRWPLGHTKDGSEGWTHRYESAVLQNQIAFKGAHLWMERWWWPRMGQGAKQPHYRHCSGVPHRWTETPRAATCTWPSAMPKSPIKNHCKMISYQETEPHLYSCWGSGEMLRLKQKSRH
jgi:hypothetical protein